MVCMYALRALGRLSSTFIIVSRRSGLGIVLMMHSWVLLSGIAVSLWSRFSVTLECQHGSICSNLGWGVNACANAGSGGKT